MMDIRPLDKNLLQAWLSFFGERAFSDNPWWGSCYCTHFHRAKDGSGKPVGMTNRAFAQWLIESGRMRGYLVFSKEGIVVGWCNANDKQAFQALAGEASDEKKRIKSVVCFVIEKAYRGQGLASALLHRVIDDARAEGYQELEAYPSARAKTDAGNYRGPLRLYLNNGFTQEKSGRTIVVRMNLQQHHQENLG